MAQEDEVMKGLLQENQGESMLFVVEDLGAPFGIEISDKSINFTDKPDLKGEKYKIIATCKEDTIIHMLQGMDPADAFFYGLIEVTGHGWFKRVMILKRLFKLGEQRGLKGKVVPKE